MTEVELGVAMPAVDPEDEERHRCCCFHVVEELDARPGPDEERYGAAREKYYACPHHELTPLEVWMGIHQQWRSR